MTLSRDAVTWAVEFVKRHSDGDMFPRLLEVDAVYERQDQFADLVADRPLRQFSPGSCRRFIVPKDDKSYRQATQLDPQDGILLSALIYQYGQGIEERRLPNEAVFSYRFAPDIGIGLYANQPAWNDFWVCALERCLKCEVVLYTDVADFYNQIYHHSVENQLGESGFPNQGTKWIIDLLTSTTAGVSRGVPVGPHGIHLIAEATMIPIDNSLRTQGIDFIRYADDIVVFCDSERSATRALRLIASILDKQQRLMLQRHKTEMYSRRAFRRKCADMIADRPINDKEDRVLSVVGKYSKGDPYCFITYDRVSSEDWNSITEEMVTDIIQEYLRKSDVDYIRLRWFYRRLAQIGHPGAIRVSLDNMPKLLPCLANICAYLASVQAISPDRWATLGKRLLGLMETEEVQDQEYFRLLMLSLFSRNAHTNHFVELAARFAASDASARREILLAGKANGAVDWLREHKESFSSMDPWQRRAFLYCLADFPSDEKKHFISGLRLERPFEEVLGKWARDA